MNRHIVRTLWVVGLAAMLGQVPVRADILYVGSSYSTWISGGSFDVSKLNGQTLAYLFCLDIPDHIKPGATYSNSVVTNDGTVKMTKPALGAGSGPAVTGPLQDYNGFSVAGKVAWLLDHYGTGGQNTTEVLALQEAIWYVIYGGYYPWPTKVTLVPALALANTYLAALDDHTGNVNRYVWISPHTTPGDLRQALVGKVPEVEAIWFLALFGTVLLSVRLLVRGRVV